MSKQTKAPAAGKKQFSFALPEKFKKLLKGKDGNSPLKKRKKAEFSTVVSLEPEYNRIRLCYMRQEDKTTFQCEDVQWKFSTYDETFFRQLAEILEKFGSKHPEAQGAPVTVVVPNEVASTDLLNLPTMRAGKANQSLDVVLRGLYKNYDDLKVNTIAVAQNKQYTTYGVSMIHQDFLQELYGAFASSRMTPSAVTFRSSAVSNTVGGLHSRLQNATYVVLDMTENSAMFTMVSRGRAAGYYKLPFGYGIMQTHRLAAEDMLFDTPEADLLILNATEKAKAKQLTMSDSAMQTAQNVANDEDEEEFGGLSTQTITPTTQTVKVLPKKTPRKLPKFMMRPAPSGEQEYAYENFRLFMKWALNLIQSNRNLLSDSVKHVLIRMPQELEYVCSMANEEKDENGVEFSLLSVPSMKPELMEDLSLYGAFFELKTNRGNNF